MNIVQSSLVELHDWIIPHSSALFHFEWRTTSFCNIMCIAYIWLNYCVIVTPILWPWICVNVNRVAKTTFGCCSSRAHGIDHSCHRVQIFYLSVYLFTNVSVYESEINFKYMLILSINDVFVFASISRMTTKINHLICRTGLRYGDILNACIIILIWYAWNMNIKSFGELRFIVE